MAKQLPTTRDRCRPTAFEKAGTASSIMERNVPVFFGHETVAVIRTQFRQRQYKRMDLVLLVDDRSIFLGVLELKDLLVADDQVQAHTLIKANWPAVPPQLDQEHAVEKAISAGVTSLPVVSEAGEPLGVIPAESLLQVLGREHREDVHRLVGIMREHDGIRHSLLDPPVTRASRRLPWLIVGLILSAGGAALMAGFEDALKGNIIIAFFIPSLVYLTDAIGTQTEAIAVRALSLHQPWPIGRLLPGEFLTGAIMGIILGVIAFGAVSLWYQDIQIGLGVGISMFAAGTLASVIGLLLPWSLSRFGIDPAFGSGPVATIIQDMLTILVYFVVMSLLLPAN